MVAWSESALWMCPNCGTSNVEGTRYCERCNLPLVPPPPTARANSIPPVPIQVIPPPPAFRRRPSRRGGGVRRTTVLAILLVVVVLVIASLALLAHFDPAAFSAPAPSVAAPAPANTTNFTVKVLQITYHISGCWANMTTAGTTVSGGSQFTAKLPLTNSGTKTCVVDAASSATNGFAVANSNTPLSVPPAQAGTLRLTIQTPDFDVDQDLTIALTVSVLG
jgi:hypothetical protein